MFTTTLLARCCVLLTGLAFVLAGPLPAAWPQGQVQVEKVSYKGWNNNLRISNGTAELIVTLDVGPRVLSYRLKDGKNVFHEYADQLGKAGEREWKIRGGHRLWVAPEDPKRTYAFDNSPVKVERVSKTGPLSFKPAAEIEYGIQKEMVVGLEPTGSRVTVVHRVTNIGKEPTELAPWTLSVMAPGGLEIIPLPAKFDHPGDPNLAMSGKDYAPNQTMVLWPFFDFKDPRCTFGSKYLTVRQLADPKRKPTKFGLAHEMGWIGYLNQGTLFVKWITYQEGRTYPDRGCNFETWTDPDMLEVESLGPLVRLRPGETAEHTEVWELVGGVREVASELDIDREVLPRVTRK